MYGNKDLWNCYAILRKIKQFACVHCILWQEMNWNDLFNKDVHQLILGIMDEVGGDLTVQEDGKEFVAGFILYLYVPLLYIG